MPNVSTSPPPESPVIRMRYLTPAMWLLAVSVEFWPGAVASENTSEKKQSTATATPGVSGMTLLGSRVSNSHLG